MDEPIRPTAGTEEVALWLQHAERLRREGKEDLANEIEEAARHLAQTVVN